MNSRVTAICISKDATILSALKQMDKVRHKLLIVLDDDRFYNLISIGDIQRSIIRGENMTLSEITRRK